MAHEIQFGQMMRLWRCLLFPAWGEVTGEKKYFDDAANQILNYTRYLWCPEKQIYYHCYHTDNKEHGVAHWSRANGWIFYGDS